MMMTPMPPHNKAPLEPSERLILIAASPRPDPEALGRTMHQVERWENLMTLAARHGVAGLVAGLVARSGGARALQRPVQERLARVRRAAFLIDHRQVSTLGEVRWRFERAGVPFLLLKGLGLAERFYAEPEDRMGRDLDILVREQHLEAAGGALEAMGLRSFRAEHYRKWHFHIPYVPGDDSHGIPVDLHWELTPAASPVQFQAREWWDSARRIELRCGPVHLPPATDELVHVAWHAFSGGSPQIRALRDVACLWATTRSPEERSATWARAQETRAGSFLHAALRLAGAFWGDAAGTPPDSRAGPSAPRRWSARKFLDGGAVVRRYADQWYPYGKIVYWSLLEGRGVGIPFLLQDTLRDERNAAWLRGQQFGVFHSLRTWIEVLTALAVAVGPAAAGRAVRSSGP